MTRSEAEAGGYDFDFLSEPPDSFKCLICFSVAREPKQHGKCGRLFCKNCLERYAKSVKKCPNCRGDDPLYFEDNKSNRDILALEVRCGNAKNGCVWEGDTRSIKEHILTCQYVETTCPRRCKKSLILKEVEDHLKNECLNRDYECPFCSDWGIYEERTTSHIEECPMILVSCPNEGCEAEVEYRRVVHHVAKDCDFTIFECKYKFIGCMTNLLRRDLEEHENDDRFHLQLVIGSVGELRKKSASLETIISSMHRENELLRSKVKVGVEKIVTKVKTLQEKHHTLSDEINQQQNKTMQVEELLQEKVEELQNRIGEILAQGDLKERVEKLSEDMKKLWEMQAVSQNVCKEVMLSQKLSQKSFAYVVQEVHQNSLCQRAALLEPLVPLVEFCEKLRSHREECLCRTLVKYVKEMPPQLLLIIVVVVVFIIIVIKIVVF